MKKGRLFDRGMIACKALHGQFDVGEKANGSCQRFESRLVGNKGQPRLGAVCLSLQIMCTVRVNLEDVEAQVKDRLAVYGFLLRRMECDVIQGIVTGCHDQMCFRAFPKERCQRFAHSRTTALQTELQI